MPTRPVRRRPRHRPSLVALPLVLLTAVVTVLLPSAHAAFTGSSSSTASSLTASSTFPDYPTQVGTGPRFYHRGDDAVSSADTSTAADSSGHSLPGTYDGPTDGPTTWWKLDETSGTTTVDASGAVNTGTLTSSGAASSWTTGQRGGSVSLDGVDDAVVGARPALDTSADFTVSAWVYLSGSALPSSDVYVVSQNGTNQAAVALEFRKSHSGATCNCWALRTTASDAASLAGNQIEVMRSTSTAALGTWTHLVGVRSGTRLRLYVNGVDDSSNSGGRSTSWNATGPLQVGRAKDGGAYAANGYLRGAVDEVKTWRRALTAAEVRDESNGDLRGEWEFEQVSSSTNPATTPSTRTPAGTDTVASPLTLRGGASSEALARGDRALHLTGATSAYADRAATVDTTRSFTVSTWVNADALGSTTRTFLSQDGSQVSGFALQYYATAGKWSFAMPDADAAGTPKRALSTSTPALNTWTHLTGVYDAEREQIRLYVGGVLEGTTARTANWSATGSFKVGQGRSGGTAVDPYNGYLDTVRAYQRAVPDAGATPLMWTGDSDVTPTGFTAGVPGALDGPDQAVTPNTAVAFAGSTNAYNPQSYANPSTFTVECWFRTTAPGGVVLGFADSTTSTTASGNSDRIVYMRSTGQLTFAVYPAGAKYLTTSASYADGQWHHLAASLGAAGMKLHVDGALVGADPAVTTAANFTGYWRWGGARIGSFAGGNGSLFTGSIDEFAVYSTQLTDLDVAHHFFSNF